MCFASHKKPSPCMPQSHMSFSSLLSFFAGKKCDATSIKMVFWLLQACESTLRTSSTMERLQEPWQQSHDRLQQLVRDELLEAGVASVGSIWGEDLDPVGPKYAHCCSWSAANCPATTRAKGFSADSPCIGTASSLIPSCTWQALVGSEMREGWPSMHRVVSSFAKNMI